MLRKTRVQRKTEVKSRESKKKRFNKGCTEIYKKLKIISKFLDKNPNNHFHKIKFYKFRKVYKSLCKPKT